MADEALDSLQQTLLLIYEYERDDDVATSEVNYQISCIRNQAAALQLLQDFPEKEIIMEIAYTTEEIVQYLFSPQNLLADGGYVDPTLSLTYQLVQLAEGLDSTVEAVVDYMRQWSDFPAVSSSSRSARKGEVEDPVAARERIVININRLRRSAEKIMSTGRELAYEDLSDSPSIDDAAGVDDDLNDSLSIDDAAGFDDDLNDSASVASLSIPKDLVVGFEEDLNDSAAVASSSRAAPTTKDLVVGFDEDILQMMERLVDHEHKLQILPIVGMGGIGKSTLAKIVYDKPLIKHHFDICAWITVAQDYSIASIVSQLLASLNGKVDQVGRNSLKGIEADKLEIKKTLSCWRYLIVIDDIWSVEAWDHARNLFPDNHNGSRIILTTRLMDVATYAAPLSPILITRFLDDKQSWSLFQYKVFVDQDCPVELETIAKKIVKLCGGLPLSIVTVAGIISKIPRTPKLWQQIEVNDGQLGTIVSLSYNHLSPHLRKCFLYMAAFPLDYEIHASELTKLWVAEGFLECQNESISAEVAAEECLEDLIKQSLVLVISRKIDGKTKSCKLHSMVWDFCVRQAGQEKFILSVMNYFPNPILRKHFLPQVLRNHPRISAAWYDLHLIDSTHSSCTTSIICISQRGYRPKGYVENFSSLRVLHVLRTNDHSYWELGQVFELIYLTYLASNIPDSIVPPAIAKLQNLQTLIIYSSDVHLPVEIWRLRQLRHLIAFSFCPLLLPEGATLSLENLQTLSMATDFVCSERMVRMIPNIKKLGICYSEEKFSEDYYLDNLVHLLRLEKLKLEVHSSFVPHIDNIVFPPSLIKLELSGGWISWNDMAIIGLLPNLQVLKLKNYACFGEQWETIDEGFGNLIHLLIDGSNLNWWRTDSSHFPRLQCLTLHHCPYLVEIPLDIGEIPTLQLIEVDDHSQSLLYSAKKIQEEQWEYGNEDLKVHVKRS